MADSQALGQLFSSLQRGTIVHYLHVSAACLFMYDYFTTLSDEVTFIWNARWGPGKALLLLVRYITWPELLVLLYIELFDITTKTCHRAFVYTAWSLLFGVTVSEMVLILRTWAIWGARRNTLLLLCALLLGVTAVNSYIVAYYINHTTSQSILHSRASSNPYISVIRAAGYIPGVTGCVLVASTHKVGIAWMTVTVFEFVIVVMTMIKGLEHYKTSASSLFPSLYRDGILYFVFLFTISLVNMIVIYTAPDEYIILLAETQRAFHALLACKIILHLRASAAARQVDVVSRPSAFVSTAIQLNDVCVVGARDHIQSVSVWFGGDPVDTRDESTFEMFSMRSTA
ncbi:hypothetical protein AURDEDRAFT_172160 [Auricularia subglabra TFB-10046 SS5]|nr:hypothetical protein AURDEDRAFT_172160 [Auricularia subglabra TFB-10046 SS5]